MGTLSNCADVTSAAAKPFETLGEADIAEVIARFAEQRGDVTERRILLIIPDGTRTAPVGQLFRLLYEHIGTRAARFDVMVALGTHPPMSEKAILQRLAITEAERRSRYPTVKLMNHAWDDPAALMVLGTLEAQKIAELTCGRFTQPVDVQINRIIEDYDELMVLGPVFPHEVVGFSGGNKYFFPGISGPDVLNFFHWLGALVTNPEIIGHAKTPVRRVIDEAATLIPNAKSCVSVVTRGEGLAGIFAGTPEAAWAEAAELSLEEHVVHRDTSFHTILSCAPPMYDELWVAGKCMYKLEPVLADGGELIIYAPHLSEVSLVHGRLIREIGYHCRDYFLGQWPDFEHYPWGVLAHSTHVYGAGTYEDGVETPRARVTLATGIDEETCRAIHLGYRDPASIEPRSFADREGEGILLVPKAGEDLFRLRESAAGDRGE